jgi:OFA family oxalate/formate antiporter-like MFS transporter
VSRDWPVPAPALTFPAMSEAAALPLGGAARTSAATRWGQLVLGIICMSMIANLQYGWTLFVNPIHVRHGWGLPSIQLAFTVFVVIETWLVPLEGYIVDRIGPRFVGVIAGVLVGIAWVINGAANSLAMLYVGAVVGGVGAGAVYGACVGNALKWFPDRRGLAAGLTAMGFGAGSALTVFPIANMIKSHGYETTFFRFGLVQGAVVVVISWFLRAPDASFTAAPSVRNHAAASPARNHTPIEMLRTPAFWVMYVMFVLTAAGGLIATAQLTPIAQDFGIADIPVSLLGLTGAALPFALSLNRILNGVSRPAFGWVSDHIGRENTMFLAFALEGVAILLLGEFGHDPVAFVLLTGLTFFAYGEIYSLFPATCGDEYGRKFAAANAGLLYTGKGVASLLVPVSSVIGGSGPRGWHTVFVVAAVMNLVASAMALVALKPARRAVIAQ